MGLCIVICELGFRYPDPKNPKYSRREVDFYMWVPVTARKKYHIGNHRLSLRKNLITGEFEVYRYFYEDGKEEVAFSGDFEGALEFAGREWNRYFGLAGWRRVPDKPCQHEPPDIDHFFCPKYGGA